MIALPSSLPADLHATALAVVACAPQQTPFVMLADMREPSADARLYVLDLTDRQRPRLILRTQVAHGYGSDPKRDGHATRFSSIEGSGMTSLGLYRVAAPYVGKHGHSYHLAGLQASNANAEARNIELHPADYVSPGHVGHSAGCAAVAPSVIPELDQRFGTLTGALLYVDGPGAVVPSCKAAREPWPVKMPGWLGRGARSCS